jgi:hypothetical protein
VNDTNVKIIVAKEILKLNKLDAISSGNRKVFRLWVRIFYLTTNMVSPVTKLAATRANVIMIPRNFYNDFSKDIF